MFEAAQRVSRDNSKWSPRKAEPGQWLLRSVVKCGTCGVGVSCHRMRGRNGTVHRYYYCRNHDPLRARGEHRRCPERNIRSDALDRFVFDQVRAVLQRPDVLLAGEHAVSTRAPAPDDELLAAQLTRLDRKGESAEAERRRLVDLYQGGLIELVELQHRAKELDARRKAIEDQRRILIEQRSALAKENRLRQRVRAFAERVIAALDGLDFDQRQKLLRLVIEEVRVTGWSVEIRLRIPLDPKPGGSSPGRTCPPKPVSTNDRLRSLGRHRGGVVPAAAEAHPGRTALT
jgi:site-specific DNA recombinase